MRVSRGEDGVVEAGEQLELILRTPVLAVAAITRVRSSYKSKARRAARELWKLNAKGLRRKNGLSGHPVPLNRERF